VYIIQCVSYGAIADDITVSAIMRVFVVVYLYRKLEAIERRC